MANTTSAPAVADFSMNLRGTQLFLFIFLALLVSFTAFGNVLVCLAICKTRGLRTSSNMLIVNMALGDILYSLSTLPLSMVLLCFRFQWPIGWIGNVAFDALWFSFLVLSFINVVMVAFDKYMAVTKPFAYKATVTKRRVFLCCTIVWVYAALLTFALTFTFRHTNGQIYFFLIPGLIYYIILLFHAGMAFILIPLFYAKVFSIAKRHRREIANQQDTKARRKFYREMKATRTVGMILVLFLLVWLPFLTNQFVDFHHIYVGVWDATNSAVCYVTYCNGPVNIFVYSCWNRGIRRAILRIILPSKFRMKKISTLGNCQRSQTTMQI